MKYKNIRVKLSTWARLTKRGKKGQSYDDVINELLGKEK